MTIEVEKKDDFQGGQSVGGDPGKRDEARKKLGGEVAQTWAVTVPHASGQMAFGRCAAGNGVSLTTVGSALVDAAGTLTLQSKGALTGQTNAVLKWLSQTSTQAHSQGAVEVFAGGGMAPGDCGAGIPSPSTKSTTPADKTEMAVNLALTAASLGRNVVEFRGAESGMAKAAVGLDAAKNALEGTAAATGNEGFAKAAAGAEMLSGAASIAANPTDIGNVAGALGTIGSGAAGAAGGSDITERATQEIKMVAGKKITAVALAGFDYKTLTKFAVTAGMVVDFTTINWAAFCLLKWEVKSLGKVKTSETTLEIEAKTTGKMESHGPITFKSPSIFYKGKVNVKEEGAKTGHLSVKDTVLIIDEMWVEDTSFLKSKLTVENDMILKQRLKVKKDAQVVKDIKVKRKKEVKKDFIQMAKADLA